MTSDRNRVAELGCERIDWTAARMPLLARLRAEMTRSRPFAGTTVGVCLHLEPKTAALCLALKEGGAEVVATGSPGTTKDDVVEALRVRGVVVYGCSRDDQTRHEENIRSVVSHQPKLVLDNGADLLAESFTRSHPSGHRLPVAATEETTSGANRLRGELDGHVKVPVIVINDSPLKLIMENEHGVGPTMVEAFMRTTNLQVKAKRFVVFGYGSVGRGIARTLRNAGACVSVAEPDPIRALQAALDGMLITNNESLWRENTVFITATAKAGIISRSQIALLPDGAILANAGHFPWEIDVDAVRAGSQRTSSPAEHIEEFVLTDGRRITVLSNAQMLNLAAGGGNPIETMDLGLALQCLSLQQLGRSHTDMLIGPQPVPDAINQRVAMEMVSALSCPTRFETR